MISIREATGRDVPAIRALFLACYERVYPDESYYDETALNRLVYSVDNLMLVAEDPGRGGVLASASVVFSFGAHSNLVGEFGRLVVHPDARHTGIGQRLMEERIRRVEGRLHAGIVEARVAHPWSMRIAEAHHFAPVGLLPLKMLLAQRESLALYVQYFGHGLELRRNHPRVVPEVYPLAHLALENCGLLPDTIIDEDSQAYPSGGPFEIEELTTRGYAPLLRIERGRVHHREIFGPVRLHYGFFLFQAGHSRYLIAREEGRIAGAVGFTLDPVEKVARVFEPISVHDGVVSFLLRELERRCRQEWDVCYLEVDVSAHSPRMQRTLIELQFLPAAYVPALVFHDVERLDVVKMVRLFVPAELSTGTLTSRVQAITDVVLRQFTSRSVLPRVAQAVEQLPLFRGLDPEQLNRLAGVCRVSAFESGEAMFRAGEPGRAMFVVLEGEVGITVAGAPVARLRMGDCVGEMSLLTGAAHSATAMALTPVLAAVLARDELGALVRQRPDIGQHLYKTLAVGLGEKLKRSD